MRGVESQLDTYSPNYKSFRSHNLKLIEEFRQKIHDARYSRRQRDLDRLARQKKMTIPERLEHLLDPGTPFLELSTLAANKAYDGEAPGAAQVTGIGVVSGKEVMIRADDSSIKGGAWYPLSVKKMVRALDIAIENHLPVVHMCDSAGGFLPMQSQIFADRYYAGRIFRNQCILSKMQCQQLSIVFGHCTAGGAYIPALSDYSVMVRGNGGIFLGGPPLVKAATGEEVSAEELGGASVHTVVSGVSDYRGFNADEGWRHGVAHGADWLLQLSLNPRVGRDGLLAMRDAVGAQIAPAAHAYVFGESERLARVIQYMSQRDAISSGEWGAWLTEVSGPGELGEWNEVFFSEPGLVRRHNVKGFLAALFVGVETSADGAGSPLQPGLGEAIAQVP